MKSEIQKDSSITREGVKITYDISTNGGCEVHAKGQRSKVKCTEFKTQHNRFRIVTPV